MSKLFPTPPSLTQLRFTQLEKDLRSQSSIIHHEGPTAPTQFTEPNSIRTASRDHLPSNAIQSQTLTQVAGAKCAYNSNARQLKSPSQLPPHPQQLSDPPSVASKKRAFRPPLRRSETGDDSALRPLSASSVNDVWDSFDSGRFVQASDLVQATAALYDEVTGDNDYVPQDSPAPLLSHKDEESRRKEGNEFTGTSVAAKQSSPSSDFSKKELERHPFSTRKAVEKTTATANESGCSSASSPLSDFQDDIYVGLDGSDADKLDRRPADDTGLEFSRSNFDQWLSNIETEARDLDFPPDLGEVNFAGGDCIHGPITFDSPPGRVMTETKSRFMSPQSNISKSSNEFGPSCSIMSKPSDSGQSSDDVIPMSSLGYSQPTAGDSRTLFHDSRPAFADQNNPIPHFNHRPSSSARSYLGETRPSFDDLMISPDSRRSQPSTGKFSFRQLSRNQSDEAYSSYPWTASVSQSSERIDRSSEDRQLISVSQIPTHFRSFFAFSHFNRVQSMIFEASFRSSKSLVVSAPTGSGKTVVFELALLRLLLSLVSRGGGGDGNESSSIAVYMAPTKALCNEKYEDWKRRFEAFGPDTSCSCHLMTGDSDLDLCSPEFVNSLRSNRVCVVVSTPEKWDMMTRNWREGEATSAIRNLKLVMIDEVHHLGDATRGPTLEAVVSRLKIIDRSGFHRRQSSIRFVAVSATIPNIEDIAQWLGDDEPAVHQAFGTEFRPVKLRHVVLSYPDQESKYLFDRNLSYRIKKMVETYAEGKPTLIFCTTRKMTEFSASEIVKDWRSAIDRDLEAVCAEKIECERLRRVLLFGVAFHHAGLSLSDRKEVESLFLQNKVSVLFATSTLATGVNLPAHLVILKSTFQYASTGYVELNENHVLQMIGRAGRPQFDQSATVVIMTQHSTREKYEFLVRGEQVIDSSFHKSLVENLNAEISLASIHSVDEAVTWLKSTFFFQRFMRDPEKYGFNIETDDPLKVDRELQKLCRSSVKSLAGIECVLVNDRFEVSPTNIGKLMAKYCIAFETMKMIYELKGEASMSDLLMLLSRSVEFADVALRQSEKSILNRLSEKKNPERIRYPLDSKVKTNYHKVFVIVQAALEGVSFSDISLTQESLMIFRSAPRIAVCLMEFLLTKRRDYKLCIHGIYLAKSIKARMWEDSRLTMKQLKGIGDKMAQVLVDAGYTDFASIRKADCRRLEMVLNRAPPFGNYLIQRVQRLPIYTLTVETVSPIRDSMARLRVVITLSNRDDITLDTATTGRYHHCVLVVGDADNNVAYLKRVYDSELFKTGKVQYEFKVDRAKASPELQIHFLSTEFVGLDIWIARTPLYLDLNSSEESNESGAASTGTEERVKDRQNPVEPPSRDRTKITKTGKRGKGPCAHNCVNKQICKHECCKVRDSSSMKQQSISRFLKKKDGDVSMTEESEKENKEERESSAEASSTISANNGSNSSLTPLPDDDVSISQKLSQKMSKFQFRPLQKVPPMIRDKVADNGEAGRRNVAQLGAANRFPPGMTEESRFRDEDEIQHNRHVVQSTFNHQRAPSQRNDALPLSPISDNQRKGENKKITMSGVSLDQPRLPVHCTVQNDHTRHNSSNELGNPFNKANAIFPKERSRPFESNEILSPKIGIKRQSSTPGNTMAKRRLSPTSPPSIQSVIKWATSPIEEEISNLKKDLEELKRSRKEAAARKSESASRNSPEKTFLLTDEDTFLSFSGYRSLPAPTSPKRKVDYRALLDELDDF